MIVDLLFALGVSFLAAGLATWRASVPVPSWSILRLALFAGAAGFVVIVIAQLCIAFIVAGP